MNKLENKFERFRYSVQKHGQRRESDIMPDQRQQNKIVAIFAIRKF